MFKSWSLYPCLIFKSIHFAFNYVSNVEIMLKSCSSHVQVMFKSCSSHVQVPPTWFFKLDFLKIKRRSKINSIKVSKFQILLFFVFRIIWLEAMISWEFDLNTKHILNLGFQPKIFLPWRNPSLPKEKLLYFIRSAQWLNETRRGNQKSKKSLPFFAIYWKMVSNHYAIFVW